MDIGNFRLSYLLHSNVTRHEDTRQEVTWEQSEAKSHHAVPPV